MRRWGIAFFDAYASLDGSGMALLEILRRLDRTRFEPQVILPRGGPLLGALEREGIPTRIEPPPSPLDTYGGGLAAAGVLTKLRAGAAVTCYALRLRRVLRGVDLLHCNQTRAALMAAWGGRMAGAKVAWNVRIRERLPEPLVRAAARSADVIVPLTRDTFDDLRCSEALMRRATVIPNAVDLERFRPGGDGAATRAALGIPLDAPVILSVGVLVERKGHDVLIRAMPQVLIRHPDARLVIAGGSPQGDGDSYRARLEALAREHDVSDRVLLVGRRDDIPNLLAAADLFALASRHEGQPGAVLEAMATETPVVVTPAAASGVRDGGTGMVVPEGDVRAVAAAVDGLLADRGLARTIARAGRAHVERHHDLDRMVRAYERVYLELLEAG